MPRYAWILALTLACGILLWSDVARIQRVRYVSGIGGETTTVDPASPTGYAEGKRWLVVPEHCTPSYQWIEETQQMVANGRWRLHRIDYENAPFGREVHSAALYHDWLALLARGDRALFKTPLGLAVERAALWSETTVHLIVMIASTLFVAFCWGNVAALAVALTWIGLFPLAAAFLPGVPQDLSFSMAFALGSVVPLLASVSACAPSRKEEDKSSPAGRRCFFAGDAPSGFFLAGLAGGFGLWNNASKEMPVLVGIALGGILAGLLPCRPIRANENAKTRLPSPGSPSPLPWRLWGLAGAATSLLAYLVEYAPSHLDLRLQVNHPLFALAWLGAAELLTQLDSWKNRAFAKWNLRQVVALALGVIAVAALPVAFAWTKTQGFLEHDPLGARLTSLPEGVVAKNLLGWLKSDGLSPRLAATFLPIVLLAPAVWLLLRSAMSLDIRRALALALGPVVVGTLLALAQLRWWSMTDAVLVAAVPAVVAAITDAASPLLRKAWWAFLGVVLALGLFASTSDLLTRKKDVFTRLEVESLVERDLAYWLADRVAGTPAVILAPPERTPTLCFFGGLHGIATPNWENQEGVSATVRIVSSTTVDEAQALLGQRNATHLILPSWDSDLDRFVEWTLPHPNDSFLHALHEWALPPWLRALPYKIPTIAGFEDQSAVVLELTDENERAPSLARLAEYFVETEQFDLAKAADQSLQVYPADLGALVARAQVEKSTGEAAAYAKTFKALLANLSGGNDRVLPWDRRVSLAIVLAQGEQLPLARKQVEHCLKEIDPDRIHSLTTGSLFRLQVLAKAFDLKIANPQLRELALKPLSPELRSRL